MKLFTFTAIVLRAGASQMTRAAELQPDTLTAWTTYLQQADSHTQERASGRLPFLWMDESPDHAARVRRGEVAVASVVGHDSASVARDLIHDWIGTIFVPGPTIDRVWMVVHDCDNYQRMYHGRFVERTGMYGR
jgi:ABC-type Fe2+-enterobactin transport system substrate-binding protein